MWLSSIALCNKWNIANYKKNELLIRIGEYKPGADKDADFAIKYIDKVNNFLKQAVEEKSSFQETLNTLLNLFTWNIL